MRTPPWRSFQKKFGPATDADATNFVRSTQALRPSFSGSCARPAASIIDGPGQRGGDCGSTSPRSLDELAQFLTHTAHYSPVMIAPLSIKSSHADCALFFKEPGDGRDPHIPLTRVRETQTILERLGAEVIVQIYPGAGHGITEEEVRFTRGLLNGDRN